MPTDSRTAGRRFFAFARRHTASELIAVAGIWARLALVDLRLKIMPYRLNRGWLFDHGAVDNAIFDPTLRSEALRLDRLVDIAAGHPFCFTMSCLRRALVLRSLLAAQGFGAHLVFGVRGCPCDHTPAAHTWLEADNLKLGLGSTRGEPGFIAFHSK